MGDRDPHLLIGNGLHPLRHHPAGVADQNRTFGFNPDHRRDRIPKNNRTLGRLQRLRVEDSTEEPERPSEVRGPPSAPIHRPVQVAVDLRITMLT